MAQYTVQIPIVQSAFIDQDNPNTNFGNLEYVRAGANRTTPGTGKRYYALFRWDHNQVPPNVKSAKLYVFNRKSLKLFYNFEVVSYHRILGDWNEGSVDYNNAPINLGWSSIYQYKQNLVQGEYIALDFAPVDAQNPYGISVTVDTAGDNDDYAEFNSSRSPLNKPYIELVCEDVPPSRPIIKEPNGVYRDSSSDILFAWDYVSMVGGAQKAYDLQWSTDQENWNTVSEVTLNTYCYIPADTFPAGNIYWRVRTYSEDDLVGEYSDNAIFYAIGAPSRPTIQSISNSSKPEIAWSASEQQMYQVQILSIDNVMHDSGERPGIIARSYQVPVYLTNGSYIARVRTKNEYGMYSPWDEAEFTVNVEQPTKPVISIHRCIYGLELHISNAPGKTLIYRNDGNGFICIGEAKEFYTDYAVASGTEYEYFARTVNSVGGFADSDVVSMRAELRHNLFAPISNLGDIVVLKYNKDTIPAKAVTLNPMGNTTYYAGRTYAVTEYSEHEESAINFTFFIKEPDVVIRLRELIRKRETVLYRDSRGRKMYGTIYGYSEVDDRLGYQITFALAEVDYNEEVDG